MTDAIGSQSLLSIYGVYEKLKGKDTSTTGGAAAGASGSSSATSKPEPPAVSSPTPESELFKSQGNAAMARKDHAAAIDLYSKAIAVAPTNPIYLSNRAAAYSASHKHAEACTDAEMAVAADPKYTKAWSRLGLARFVLGDARGSMEAYAKGIEYEGSGGSEAMKKGFKTAKEKVDELEREKEAGGLEEDLDDGTSAASGGGGGGGGMPDLSALAGMMGGGGGGGRGGGGGGMPDLGSLMSNPMFASMAQNLMSNPEALQGLMNNPQLRGMAERFGLGGGGAGGGGGGGGGMPDLSALAGMMGGAGRGGAGGAGAGAGGGGGGGMPDLASMMNDPNIAEM